MPHGGGRALELSHARGERRTHARGSRRSACVARRARPLTHAPLLFVVPRRSLHRCPPAGSPCERRRCCSLPRCALARVPARPSRFPFSCARPSMDQILPLARHAQASCARTHAPSPMAWASCRWVQSRAARVRHVARAASRSSVRRAACARRARPPASVRAGLDGAWRRRRGARRTSSVSGRPQGDGAAGRPSRVALPEGLPAGLPEGLPAGLPEGSRRAPGGPPEAERRGSGVSPADLARLRHHDTTTPLSSLPRLSPSFLFISSDL